MGDVRINVQPATLNPESFRGRLSNVQAEGETEGRREMGDEQWAMGSGFMVQGLPASGG